MKCPSCGSEDVAYGGTVFMGKDYEHACNKCGYCWNSMKCVMCNGECVKINNSIYTHVCIRCNLHQRMEKDGKIGYSPDLDNEYDANKFLTEEEYENL
jgi:hypothetical protein